MSLLNFICPCVFSPVLSAHICTVSLRSLCQCSETSDHVRTIQLEARRVGNLEWNGKHGHSVFKSCFQFVFGYKDWTKPTDCCWRSERGTLCWVNSCQISRVRSILWDATSRRWRGTMTTTGRRSLNSRKHSTEPGWWVTLSISGWEHMETLHVIISNDVNWHSPSSSAVLGERAFSVAGATYIETELSVFLYLSVLPSDLLLTYLITLFCCHTHLRSTTWLTGIPSANHVKTFNHGNTKYNVMLNLSTVIDYLRSSDLRWN